jgi:hypothetical protein
MFVEVGHSACEICLEDGLRKNIRQLSKTLFTLAQRLTCVRTVSLVPDDAINAKRPPLHIAK